MISATNEVLGCLLLVGSAVDSQFELDLDASNTLLDFVISLLEDALERQLRQRAAESLVEILPDLVKIDDADWDGVDAVFCGLPHGTTQDIIAALPRRLKVVDLSADFRLADVDTYAQWYGHAHRAPELQKEAVYGLTELKRPEIAKARLVANPGCYPTSAQLPLVPLVAAGQIETDDIIIDAKSGVSGAGRDAKQGSLFTEVAEGIHAYGVASHRHGPEIEQGLSEAAGRPTSLPRFSCAAVG